jgi:hypothetical protein
MRTCIESVLKQTRNGARWPLLFLFVKEWGQLRHND